MKRRPQGLDYLQDSTLLRVAAVLIIGLGICAVVNDNVAAEDTLDLLSYLMLV